MSAPGPGFAVLYRWRLRPGAEASFVEAWSRTSALYLVEARQRAATGLALQFVVVLKSTSKAIGTCLLFRLEEASARAELGYVLGRTHWRRGIMREALVALLDHAFGQMVLRRVEAEVDVRNASSARVLHRLGFTKEGLLRARWVSKGEARDVEMYGLLRDEWLDGSRHDAISPDVAGSRIENCAVRAQCAVSGIVQSKDDHA